MKRSFIRWGAVLGIVLIGSAAFYTYIYQPKSTYQSVSPQSGTFDVWIQGIGELDAQLIYDLGFPVSGRMTELHADHGDRVKAGALLAQLDASELMATLEETQAFLEKTQLEIQATQQDIQLNQERYNLSKLLYDRNKIMLQKQAISQAQFDESESNKLQANIALESSKTRLKLIRAELNRIEKSRDVIQAKLDNLKLYAPVDGIIIERMAEVGESPMPGQPVFKMIQPDSLWVKAYIDERVSGQLAPNQPAEIRLRSQPEHTFNGYVKRIDAQSDPVTLERVVYLGFNPPLPEPFLYEQAQIKIHTHTLEQTLNLPNAALSIYKTQHGLWLNQAGRAHFMPIDVLASNPTHFAFQADLDLNTRVIVPHKDKKPLFEGARALQ
ncbi:efflux RND transporter periplasmic adaptor subunit [Thiomicrorhabdus chilensis]|uniref:efflux RND transporter periplasmic adaptor subunit n=1 Tax=Thiomicrorhabdus chilensis TaxID=63656 RepID=UPI0004158CB2|nr:efflux RND transporter periplasmic adaptor subunit [Thiomicrorhabdus chilensis]